jgi:hypothetical protein
MNIQFGGCVNQTHRIPNMVTMHASRLQMVYTTLIMITQANKSMGWPPLIPMTYERQKTKSMVNPKAWILVARPYQLVLKYPDYKK